MVLCFLSTLQLALMLNFYLLFLLNSGRVENKIGGPKITADGVVVNSQLLAMTRALGHRKLSYDPEFFQYPLSRTGDDRVRFFFDHSPDPVQCAFC
mmetsp:Transcript_16199/g.41666  ORF Transcript_16199/g.41666 Transcript_16199/m.41666 type:complete len:96 (-) Transcript_16199:1449-1736(-)